VKVKLPTVMPWMSMPWTSIATTIVNFGSSPPVWPTSLVYNGYRFIPEGKAAGAWRWLE
jgi:hypothetical protein